MFKRILVALATLFALSAFAAVDANKATQAELEGIKGIGPAIAAKILDERKKGDFKDWTDLVTRVKGVGEGNAAKFSADGLTVAGAPYKGVAPAEKKATVKPSTAAPAASSTASADKSAPKAAPSAAPAAPAAPASAPASASAKQSKKDKKKAAADAASAAKK